MRIPGVANINKSLVVFKKSLKECLTQGQSGGRNIALQGQLRARRIIRGRREVYRNVPGRGGVPPCARRASRTSPSSKLDMEPFGVHSRG